MMDWIVNNWGLLLIFLTVIVGLIDLVRNDKEKAAKWLLFACLEAEREFGSKTGVMKLRSVYEKFLAVFPILSKFISFQEFSDMVDKALEEMEHYINTNVQIFKYVKEIPEEK